MPIMFGYIISEHELWTYLCKYASLSLLFVVHIRSYCSKQSHVIYFLKLLFIEIPSDSFILQTMLFLYKGVDIAHVLMEVIEEIQRRWTRGICRFLIRQIYSKCAKLEQSPPIKLFDSNCDENASRNAYKCFSIWHTRSEIKKTTMNTEVAEPEYLTLN